MTSMGCRKSSSAIIRCLNRIWAQELIRRRRPSHCRSRQTAIAVLLARAASPRLLREEGVRPLGRFRKGLYWKNDGDRASALYVCTEEFDAEGALAMEHLPNRSRTCRPSPTPFECSLITLVVQSRPKANRSVFNMMPCDNDFERVLARFLENAAGMWPLFAKLPKTLQLFD